MTAAGLGVRPISSVEAVSSVRHGSEQERERAKGALRLRGRQLLGGLKKVNQTMLNELKADINVFGSAIEMVRRWENDRTTGSKQHAKRSQWAGRLIIDRARYKNNVGKSC